MFKYFRLKGKIPDQMPSPSEATSLVRIHLCTEQTKFTNTKKKWLHWHITGSHLTIESVNLRYKQCIFHPVAWTNEHICIPTPERLKQKTRANIPSQLYFQSGTILGILVIYMVPPCFCCAMSKRAAYGKFLPGVAASEDPKDCSQWCLRKISRGQVLEEEPGSLRQTSRLKTVAASPPFRCWVATCLDEPGIECLKSYKYSPKLYYLQLCGKLEVAPWKGSWELLWTAV